MVLWPEEDGFLANCEKCPTKEEHCTVYRKGLPDLELMWSKYHCILQVEEVFVKTRTFVKNKL